MTQIHPTAVVDPGARLGVDVEIGPYCVIGPHVAIGDRARLMSHVVLDGWTTLGAECRVFPFASIGTQTQDLKYAGGRSFVEIGEHTTLREYVTVNSGTAEGEVTRVGSQCHIMAYSHVAHACQVGNGVILSNGATLAGHVIIEDQAGVAGLSGVHQFVRIGKMAFVGAMTKITQDVPPFLLVDGNPATARGINQVGLERRDVTAESRQELKKAYRILYREGLSTKQAVEKIKAAPVVCAEIQYLLAFIEGSERGIIK